MFWVSGDLDNTGTVTRGEFGWGVPTPDDCFTLLSWATVTGEFAAPNGLEIGDGLACYPYFDEFGFSLLVYSD